MMAGLLSALIVSGLVSVSEVHAQASGPEPTAPAPVEPVTSPEPTPPVTAEPPALRNPLPEITGLIMQPVYFVVKMPVAAVGAVVGAFLWPFSGDKAEQVWNATVRDPWGWPDFVRRLGS